MHIILLSLMLQFTIKEFDKYSNVNERRLPVNMFLYAEKLYVN